MTRLPLSNREDMPADMLEFWDRLAAGGLPRNIHRVQGNNPEVLRGSRTFSNTLWTKGGFDPATRELIILRTARAVGSRYEWQQHVPIGIGAGLSRERIIALSDWQASSLYSAEERAILATVDSVTAMGEVPEGVIDELKAHVPASEVVSVTMLCCFYLAIARFMVAMDLTLEGPFIGWGLEGLPT
jgi:4-carboxymuconolactone decarboxylase